jgi:long-chain acyl-CoA synthetase
MSEERPWLKHYAAGIPANINPDEYPTLNGFIDESLKKYKNRKAYSCFGKELTYQQVDDMSRNFGAYLHSRGLQPGDRIALMMPNLLQYPIALFGALRAGLIVVNTNPLYTAREMHHQFKDSGVKAVIIAENFAHNLEKIIQDTEIKTVIVTSLGELLGFPKGNIINFVVRTIKKMVPKYNLPNTVKFKEAIKGGKKFKLPVFEDHPHRVILHQYTGGTTGVAKGAMLTNRNIVTNMLQIRSILSTRMTQDSEKVLCPLPLYHIFAFTTNCLAMLGVGALSILVTNPRDLDSLVKEFKKYPISIMTGVNTLFNALLNHEGFQKANFDHLKITVGGGMAVQKAVGERWQKLTGCPLTEGYGLTETSPVASVNPIDGTGKLGSIGFPVPSTDMRVVDENGNILGPNEVGEIQIKGPQVMKGYYNRPDETAKVLKDGWLSTGDVAIMHDDGYFEIVDRKKDMINVSGFNVYPNEIEEVIATHDKVLEVAAIGIPDPKSNEVVKVFIVKKDPSLTEKELIDFCREEMTGYKVPKAVEWRDELPKSTVGKILRRVLKDEEEKNRKEAS